MTPEELQRLEKLEQEMREHYHNGLVGREIWYKDLVGKKIYSGMVDSSGNSIHLPKSWSCSRTATGKFTVTHGLGETVYGVAITPIDLSANADNVCFTIPTHGANTFTVEFVQSDSPLTYINTAFSFVLY